MSNKQGRKKVIIIGPTPRSLVNFRGELIRSMVMRGHEVQAVAPKASIEEISEISQLGASYVDLPIDRVSMNPLKELKTLFYFRRYFKKEKPDFVLSYTIKPVIWSGLALLGASARFTALITGLGYAFNESEKNRSLLNRVVTKLYERALKRAETVIFQNKDDFRYFTERSIACPNKCHVVAGSGVPSKNYEFTPVPNSKTKFLMVSRLLAEKGVRYYAEAAQKVVEIYPEVEFHLVGGFDISPGAISPSEVEGWVAKGILQYHGESLNVKEYLKSSHIFVLPSFYREGLPRTILEAMSIGRPVITTDNVGCREAVYNHVNGLLVPIKDTEELVAAMIYLIENSELLPLMGREGRKLVESTYDVDIVNKHMLSLIFELESC